MKRLLSDLARVLDPDEYEILFTRNIPEPDAHWYNPWRGRFLVIENARPKGFAANHNAALAQAQGLYVAAIDPDLRFSGDPFPALSVALGDPAVGIVSTRVVDDQYRVVDHARTVPSPVQLLHRYLGRRQELYPVSSEHPVERDWIAGLFMAFRNETFRQMRGFDERYFMYCEDVDLCLRTWNAGLSVSVIPAAPVEHIARRQTLKRGSHFAWHSRSLLRLWASAEYRRFCKAARIRKNTLD